MKCLKCGAYVYSSDKFCRSCGTTLTEETCQYGDNISNSKYDSSSCHTQQYDYSNTYSHTKKDSDTKYTSSYDYEDKYTFDQSKYAYAIPTDSGGEDKYVKAYIGKNYMSIKKTKFSIPAFIFGPMYLLYRKVWGYAIAMIIISFAAAFLLKSDLKDFINLAMNIFIAVKFQSIYMKQAENKVEEIKQQNLDKTTNELLNICRKKGGTSTKAPAIIFFLAALLISTALIYAITEEFESTTENTPEIVDNNKLTYTVPVGFVKEYENGFYKRYSYTPNNSISCYLTIDKTTLIENYPDEKSYLEKQMNTNMESSYQLSSVRPINLNGKEWKYIRRETPQRSEVQYAYKTNKEIFTIKTFDYKIGSQQNTVCNTKYNEFLTSIKIN